MSREEREGKLRKKAPFLRHLRAKKAITCTGDGH